MQRTFYLFILLLCTWGLSAQSVVISEIHYDNVGTDVNEAVEITGPAGFDLAGWKLELYNGNGGAIYNTKDLSGVFADQGDGYGAICFSYPVNGIQNGAPDGLALINAAGEVVEFLSYEGFFTATSGTASGLTSTDIGVEETSSTLATESLQRTGPMSWIGPVAANCGTVDADLVASLPPVGDDEEAFCSLEIAILGTTSCDDNGTIYADDDTFEATFEVTIANRPETGVIEFTGDQLEVIDPIDVTSLGSREATFSVTARFRSGGGALEFTATASAEPFCFATADIAAPAPCSFIEPCSQLFFSEIVEGTGFNKCVEIYNPTDATVDLTGYTIELYSNGNTAPNSISELSGSIEPGDVYVICNPAASAEFRFLADNDMGVAINYNGDDAFVLTDGTGIIDSYGQIGVRVPFGNQNNTLRRLYGVSNGDNNPFDSFTPDEYEEFPINESFGLGYHATDCRPGLTNGLQEIDDCGDGVAETDADGNTVITTSCILTTGYGTDGTGTGAFDRLCGDFDVSTAVEILSTSIQTGAGLLIRANRTLGTPFYAIYLEGSGRNRIIYRSSQNGIVRVRSLTSSDEYVRMTRDGSYLRLYTSSNGSSWRRRYTVRLNTSFDDCAAVGAVAFRRAAGAAFTAIFSELTLGNGSSVFAQAAPEVVTLSGVDQQVAGETESYTPTLDLARPATPATTVTELRLWPNPVRQELSLTLPAAREDRLLLITDLSGRQVRTTLLAAETEQLQIVLPADLPAGLYLLRIPTADGVVTQRFVKVD